MQPMRRLPPRPRQDPVKRRQEGVKTALAAWFVGSAGRMSSLSVGLLLAVAALTVYLLATLIFPERF